MLAKLCARTLDYHNKGTNELIPLLSNYLLNLEPTCFCTDDPKGLAWKILQLFDANLLREFAQQ